MELKKTIQEKYTALYIHENAASSFISICQIRDLSQHLNWENSSGEIKKQVILCQIRPMLCLFSLTGAFQFMTGNLFNIINIDRDFEASYSKENHVISSVRYFQARFTNFT